MGQIERLLPFLAVWGTWGFSALLMTSLLGIAWLGRGRRFLVPARWPARVASALLLVPAVLGGGGLYLVNGPMRPMPAQVRRIESLVDRPAADATFRAVADDAPHRLIEKSDDAELAVQRGNHELKSSHRFFGTSFRKSVLHSS
jgi:hypothetical protein